LPIVAKPSPSLPLPDPENITSAAKKKIMGIRIKGKRTKNQEIPECPFLHKKFKNHVHRRIKNALTTTVIKEILLSIDKNAITESTK